MSTPAQTATSATTAQRLASLIKSARRIMRKDKGLNGDLDRLPMLIWIMFLKFLDDAERVRETEAELEGKRFVQAIEPPYRWRDWATADDGITGDTLIAFINNEQTMRPDGLVGPGLFPYLRGLQGADGGDRRDVVATVFRGTVNRMINGYLLRDVVNLVDEIHFASSDEIHTLGALYESMLKEMRDAAGDSGEFYTPRPVVDFMVRIVDPQLGETVLDPACGTGGFLASAYQHLRSKAETVEDRRSLDTAIVGGEAKPLPYLLGQMNLLLHGIENPKIGTGNSLNVRLADIGERERVDVILTNPPFGGEEERGIQDNFPPDRRTNETALLFLQLLMRKLRRSRRPGFGPARAAVIVPNGILAEGGTAAKIRSDLLEGFRLHTIVRLSEGVFSPYTPIPTNILFFDREAHDPAGIWYYEVSPPNGLKQFTKTNPIQLSDFSACMSWWSNRVENDQAWLVPYTALGEDLGLDHRNPARRVATERNVAEVAEHLSSRVAEAERVTRTFVALAASLETVRRDWRTWPKVKLEDVLVRSIDPVPVDPTGVYPNVGIYSFGRGLFRKPDLTGQTTQATRLYRIRAGQFIYSRLFAFEGAFAVVPPEFDGYFVSNEYPVFDVREPFTSAYLAACFATPLVWDEMAGKSRGLGNRRQRLQPGSLLTYNLAAAPDEFQRLLADLAQTAAVLSRAAGEIDALAGSSISDVLGPILGAIKGAS